SDWGAAHETLGTVNGGLDLEMPFGSFMNRNTILPLIKSGEVKESTIDDKVRRLLRTAIRFGWLDRPQEDSSIPKINQQGRQIALQAARESIVLLKNSNNLLPLDKSKVKNIAVIGPNGFDTPVQGGGSATIYPFQTVDFLNEISNSLGTNTNVSYARGVNKYNNLAETTRFDSGLKAEFFDNLELSGTPAKTENQQNINLGKLIETNSFGNSAEFEAVTVGDRMPSLAIFAGPKPMSARWTGNFTPKESGDYEIFVQQAGFGDSNYRLFVDGKLVRDRWAISTAATESMSLFFDAKPHKIVLEFKASGGLSQHFVRLGIVKKSNWAEQNALELAKKADVVIVPVGFNASTETENFDRTFNLPPGQNELIQELAKVNKNVVVVINAGGGVEMSPWIDQVSGVLHAWYAGQEGGTALTEILFGATNPSGRLPATFERKAEDNPTFNNYYPQTGNKIEYKEGVFVGYRGYEKNNVSPMFPFGFGLSYTNFAYSNLVVKPLTDGRFEVSFSVKNTGKLDGADVAQIYVGGKKDSKVSRPIKELKGFEKVFLKAGETKKVSITLDKRAFSYFDVNSKNWRAEAGDYEILVGRSSAEIVLKGKAILKSDLISER
ncbi:MAG: glycoside hydrolase family 3 C-terminal domain-containing protein, partial [Acidobacteriota bacterium]